MRTRTVSSPSSSDLSFQGVRTEALLDGADVTDLLEARPFVPIRSKGSISRRRITSCSATPATRVAVSASASPHAHPTRRASSSLTWAGISKCEHRADNPKLHQARPVCSRTGCTGLRRARIRMDTALAAIPQRCSAADVQAGAEAASPAALTACTLRCGGYPGSLVRTTRR